MYTDLTLYYLNQLGIVPWVHRTGDKVLGQLDKRCLVLIVLPNELKGKALALFTHILNYLALSDDELITVTLGHADELHMHMTNKKPQFILSLGLTFPPLTQNNNTMLAGLSLDSLLLQPAHKKKLFQQLQQIKRGLLPIAIDE